MKRLIIICEGETEKEFCSSMLTPHFIQKNILIQAPLIKKSMGGIVKWTELEKQINNHLKSEPTVFVSMLIDYYGLYEKYSFPKWEEAEREVDKNQRMDMLECAMKERIDTSINFRFIPYLQLHEFEGLLFNDIKVFKQQIPKEEIIGMSELKNTLDIYGDNPEMINNNRKTAPSKRLQRIILGYNKVVYGNILAEAIGLNNIRAKCPRFNEWLNKLERI